MARFYQTSCLYTFVHRGYQYRQSQRPAEFVRRGERQVLLSSKPEKLLSSVNRYGTLASDFIYGPPQV